MNSPYAKLEDLQKENHELRQQVIDITLRAKRLIDAYKLENEILKKQAGDTHQADVPFEVHHD
jgi:hypothetical protein